MKFLSNKQLIAITVFCSVLLIAVLFSLFFPQKEKKINIPAVKTPESVPAAETITPLKNQKPQHEIIGYSVQNREIESYTFGAGDKLLIFVGGIHGGYEWNNVLLAYEFIDYLESNPEIIPDNLSVAIIPCANPDGLTKTTGKNGRFTIADISAGSNKTGRFNANGVDLNRNFDCNWQPKGVWRQQEVNAGTAAFSEPESAAIKNFVLQNNPAAVLFWHSQSNAVYGSMCNNDMMPETRAILNAYANASGYPAVDTFDGYQVTGDATDWLASINIPAISVELSTHETTEWQKNLAGINAIFKYYEDI